MERPMSKKIAKLEKIIRLLSDLIDELKKDPDGKRNKKVKKPKNSEAASSGKAIRKSQKVKAKSAKTPRRQSKKAPPSEAPAG